MSCVDVCFVGVTVRTIARISLLPVVLSAAVLAACGRKSSPVAMTDDLKSDLSLASSSTIDLANKQAGTAFPLTEIAPEATPAPAKTLKKGSGPRAIRSKAPTVAAAPEPTVAAESDVPQTEKTTDAPVPSTTESAEPSAPAVPRPTPVSVSMPAGGGAQDGGSTGQSGGGSAGGSILGAIFGAVIRGGTVDGDHCDPRSDGRVGRGRHGGGVYHPNPNGRSPYPQYPLGGSILRIAR